MIANATQAKLHCNIVEIEIDFEKGASISFLSRKYVVSRKTMKTFLIEVGIYQEEQKGKR